jgi:hypothetical protein
MTVATQRSDAPRAERLSEPVVALDLITEVARPCPAADRHAEPPIGEWAAPGLAPTAS